MQYTGFTGVAPLAEDAGEAIESRLLAPWERWLAALAEPPRAPEPVAEGMSFGILLKAGESGPLPMPWAAPAWFRTGSRGAPIEPQSPVPRGPEPQPAPPGGWPEAVVDALALLLDRASEKSGKLLFAPIADLPAERALLRLLAHYPGLLAARRSRTRPAASLCPSGSPGGWRRTAASACGRRCRRPTAWCCAGTACGTCSPSAGSSDASRATPTGSRACSRRRRSSRNW
ncbi:MAG: hypothetical protein RML12_01275 [Xanthomonadales bacterium]|nr:hypothetical protein [Xanthomonadales bacterium]